MLKRRAFWIVTISFLTTVATIFSYALPTEAQSIGTISGTITGDQGVPLEEITVTLYRQENFTGIISYDAVTSTHTTATGMYTLTVPHAGIYRVNASGRDSYPRYFEQWYSAEPDMGNRTDIVIHEGDTISGIDLQLSSGAHIFGKVTDPDGMPISAIRVWIRQDSGYFRSTITTVDGTYELDGLAAGIYYLQFTDERYPEIYQRQHYQNVTALENATPITLATEQILTNVDVQLERLALITGRVTDAEGALIPHGITVYAEKYFPDAADQWGYNVSANLDANGRYTLPVDAGVYRIKAEDGLDSYASEYYGGAWDPTEATTFTVAFDTVVPNIDIQLDPRGTIAGTVYNLLGEPLPQITVEILQFGARGASTWWPIEQTQTDDVGRYTFCCLDFDKYIVRFSDRQGVYNFQYHGGALLKEDATQIAVTPNTHVTGIDAHLTKRNRIYGHVINQSEEPVADFRVQLYVRELSYYDGEPMYSWRPIESTETDTNGFYEFAGLETGDYRLFFTDTIWPHRFHDRYYQNATTLEEATILTLTHDVNQPANLLVGGDARFVIHVDSQPDSKVNFRIGGDLGSFRLDDPTEDDGDAYSRTQTINVEPGTYTLNSQLFQAWQLKDVECSRNRAFEADLVTQQITVTIRSDEIIECTLIKERRSEINARVLDDRNADGQFDLDESWLPGWTITFRDIHPFPFPSNTILDEASTDSEGRVNFKAFRGPRYPTVCEQLQTGWQTTKPTDSTCYRVNLIPGQAAWMRFFNTQNPMVTATADNHSDEVIYTMLPDSDEDGNYVTQPVEPWADETEVETLDKKIFLPSILN